MLHANFIVEHDIDDTGRSHVGEVANSRVRRHSGESSPLLDAERVVTSAAIPRR